HVPEAEVAAAADAKDSEARKWQLPSENPVVVYYYPRGFSPPSEGEAHPLNIDPAMLSAEDWAALFGFQVFDDPIGQLISDVHDRVVKKGYRSRTGQVLAPKPAYDIQDLVNCVDNCVDLPEYASQNVQALKPR